jgi:hypothetical protein
MTTSIAVCKRTFEMERTLFQRPSEQPRHQPVFEFAAEILMNHPILGVKAGYYSAQIS